jgi:ADP-ribose pyrophosphatase YjhB (NUDIX family)
MRPDDLIPAGRRSQRVAAYGVCRDGADRLLLARAAPSIAARGHWFLPGGGVQHGEDPVDTLRREMLEESGLTATIGPLLDVLSDVRDLSNGINLHTVRLVYRVTAWRGTLRPEVGGTTDAVAWFSPGELDALPLAGYVRTVVDRFV